jgi:hypothetical protein
VVNRKNTDLVLKAKEENKAVADIFMARSRGKPLLPRPDLDQSKAEKLARMEQQGKVDKLLTEARVWHLCAGVHMCFRVSGCACVNACAREVMFLAFGGVAKQMQAHTPN